MLKKIHHVGIVVRSLDEAYRFYRDILGLPVHKVAEVQDQGVKAALLTVGDSEIELLEPINANGGVAKFLEKRGEGLHHVCFETDDVARELSATIAKDVPVIDRQPRPGLAGMICFLHPKANHGVLIEYAQPFADERGAGGGRSSGAEEERMALIKKIDHVGIAVQDVDAAVATFTRNFAFPVERQGELPVLGIKRAHLRIGSATLELFAPLGAEHPVARFLATRGEGMYVLSLEVERLDAAAKALEAKGIGVRVERLPDGTQLGFIAPKQAHGVLLQLIELPAAAARA